MFLGRARIRSARQLGQGDVDFAAVVAELRQTTYAGWIVVEQDVLPGMGEPKEYARRNREFLRCCGL
jgi:inosose dehydratase